MVASDMQKQKSTWRQIVQHVDPPIIIFSNTRDKVCDQMHSVRMLFLHSHHRNT